MILDEAQELHDLTESLAKTKAALAEVVASNRAPDAESFEGTVRQASAIDSAEKLLREMRYIP